MKLLRRNTFFTLFVENLWRPDSYNNVHSGFLSAFFTQLSMLRFFKLSYYHAYLVYTAGINFGTMIQALS